MTNSNNTTCSICGDTLANPYQLLKHRKAVHPESLRRSKKVVEESSLDMIHSGEDMIRKGLKEIDAERNVLQNRIIELDDLAAKWKKMVNPHI